MAAPEATANLVRMICRGMGNAAEVAALKKFTLPDLPYAEDALEPVIGRETMHLHHGAHHKTYVNMLNAALERYQAAEKEQNLPEMLKAADLVKFNGGGHINHSLYWENLQPYNAQNEKNMPTGEIKSCIEREWGNVERMQEIFVTNSAAIQGSGYGWIGYNPQAKRIEYAATLNQELLQAKGLEPLLTVDVWEHSYYLNYHNLRMEYLKNIWKIVNWNKVNERLQRAMTSA